MQQNCTIIGQSGYSGAWGSYGQKSEYAGANSVAYYPYILQFKTPSFGGVSEKLTFNISLDFVNWYTLTLRYALCTSDANKDSYRNTVADVTESTQIAKGTMPVSFMTESWGAIHSITISTDELTPDTTYYLYLWGYNKQSLLIVSPPESHSISLDYTAETLITSAGDVTLGNACSVLWTPPAASLRYRLKFSLGNWSHTTDVIYPNTTAAYTYNGYVIPMDVAYQITDKPKDDMTVTLFTYTDSEGTVQAGSADTETFTVTVPDNEDTKPSVDMGLSLVSELSAPFDSLYIQNLTKVGADINAEGQYGASIASCQMVIGGGVYEDPFVSGYLTQTGEVTVTGKATDSRGYVGMVEQTITVIPYSKPAIVPAEGETSIVCVRCDENGNITDSGTYLKIKAKRSYSYVVSDGVQHNFCQFQYRVNGGGWLPIPSESDELDTELAGVVTSTTQAYTIEVGVIDDLGFEASVLIIVPSDQVEFHLREGGDGAAFGEYAEDARVLAVAESWELRVKGTMTIGGQTLLDLFYPVGSIYMSANSTNPATFIGGTWEQMGSADFADYIWKRKE